jgi:anti-sigma-K factor RskA
MTSADDGERDGEDMNTLAGEYVLGVLPLAERQRVEARLRDDRVLVAAVAGWERDLSALNAEYGEATPPASTLAKVEARLFAAASVSAGRSPFMSIWNSLLLWRSLAFASVAALIGYLALADISASPSANAPLVAQLSGDKEGSLTLLARYDASSGRLQLTPISAGPAAEHSLELWLVPGGENPAISLGVLPQTGEGAVEVPAQLRPRLGEGVTFAVSLEPLGGSPDGKPTGPVIAVGKAHQIF